MSIKKVRWTIEEDELLIANFNIISSDDLSKLLHTEFKNIQSRANRLLCNGKMPRRTYSEWEDEYLLTNYGTMPIRLIQNRLARTEMSIRCRMSVLIGSSESSSNCGNLTINQLTDVLGLSKTTLRKYVDTKSIPHYKIGAKTLFNIETFWNWLEDNTDIINPLKIDVVNLWACPEWYVNHVKTKKLNNDYKIKEKKWTTREESILWSMYMNGKSYNEMCDELNRNYRSIQSKVRRLILLKKNNK